MSSKLKIGALLIALLIPYTQARAQSPSAPAPAEARRKVTKELEQKALGLLDEIIKDAQSFRMAENRLVLKAIAANLLWKHDEPRARVLFKEAMMGIADLLNEQEDTDTSGPRYRQGPLMLRREVAQVLASRDARMARDFLRATRRAVSRTAQQQYSDYNSDLSLEYGIAAQLAETDPKQALEIASDNLSRGYSEELLATLNKLREKDQEAAAKLASDIVTKLRSENLTTNYQAANVAFNLLVVVFNSAGESDSKDGKKAEPLLSAQGMRELMDMNVTLALAAPNYMGRLQVIEGMMPQVEKYAPSRVAELRQKLARKKKEKHDDGDDDSVGTTETGAGPDWAKYRSLMQTGTPEELLAAAPKAPPEMRDNLYQSAATKFAEKGEVERARDIVNNNLPDTPLRQQLLAELDRQTSLTAAEQGKIEQVRKSLASLRTGEERATALAQIATALVAKNQKKIARQLLDEAHEMVNYRAKNIKQLGAQLMVAQAYVKLDPARSLAILEPIVDQLNELLAAAATLGGFIFDEEIMRDDEIRLEIFNSGLPMITGGYMPDLSTLAAADFDRTRALADRFQRDEVRILARLLVVQSLIGERPELEKQSSPPERTTTTVETQTIVHDEDTGAP